MKFSICIPNFNYGRYLGRTIQSVLDQDYADLEILVADNASTDDSMQVVRSFVDGRIRSQVNPSNLGFAGNLDQAAGMASGERLILLSSDDMMGPDALPVYERLLRQLPQLGRQSIVSAGVYEIDADDRITGQIDIPRGLLGEADRAPELDQAAGAPVYRVGGLEMLRRSVLEMYNPANFAATCYSRAMYAAVGGYGGSRVMNPDKWFLWKLLAVADNIYYVDRPLFGYRWHPANQTALQKGSGALKWLLDEYRSTFELPDSTLKSIGLTRDDLERAFVEVDIGRHGWAKLAKEGAFEARRVLHLGRAAYPRHIWRNPKTLGLWLVLPLGPLAKTLARVLYERRAAQLSPPAVAGQTLQSLAQQPARP